MVRDGPFTGRFFRADAEIRRGEQQDGGRRKRPHPSSHPPPPLRETGFPGPLRKNLLVKAGAVRDGQGI